MTNKKAVKKVATNQDREDDEAFDGLVQDALDASARLFDMWEERGVMPKWTTDEDAATAQWAFCDIYIAGQRS